MLIIIAGDCFQAIVTSSHAPEGAGLPALSSTFVFSTAKQNKRPEKMQKPVLKNDT